MAGSPRIDELRKKFDENPRRYFAPLANEYRKAGQIEQAIAICREHLPQQPGHMSGHIVFGQALYEARQFDEAKTVFETALTLDPENLIALKHLGDIALIVGDGEAARGWYKRVLDADPRNEEIQGQLARLDQGGAGAAAPAAAPSAPAPAATPAKPTPSSAPTVVVSAVRPPASSATTVPTIPALTVPTPAAPSVTATSPTAEIRLDQITPPPAPPAAPVAAEAEVPSLIDAPMDLPPAHVEPALGLEPTSFSSEPPAAVTPMEIDSPISQNKEAPPLDGFSLDGLETTALAAPPPPPPIAAPEPIDLSFDAPPAPPPAPMASAGPAEALPELDISVPAPAAPPPAPEPPAIDLDFGAVAPPAPPSAPAAAAAAPDLAFIDIPDAPPPPEAPAPAAVAPAPAAAGDDLPLLDLGDLPAAPPAAAPAAPPLPPAAPQAAAPVPQARPPAAAVPSPQPVAAPEIEPVEAFEIPTAAPESGPFVTETMAELYLKQGHRDEALRVYRALLDSRPGDPAITAKIAALTGTVAPAAASQGPSIRELLQVIAQRRPGFRAELPPQNGAPHAASAAHVGAATPMPAPSVDALAHLFGGGVVSADDERAAMTLAAAFASNGNGDLSGAPAHRAPNELSLDSVFGGAAPAQAGPPPSNFSFDQFFSQRATAEHGTPAASAETESKDDVAHFTQWLEGLKQK